MAAFHLLILNNVDRFEQQIFDVWMTCCRGLQLKVLLCCWCCRPITFRSSCISRRVTFSKLCYFLIELILYLPHEFYGIPSSPHNCISCFWFFSIPIPHNVLLAAIFINLFFLIWTSNSMDLVPNWELCKVCFLPPKMSYKFYEVTEETLKWKFSTYSTISKLQPKVIPSCYSR